MERNEVGPRAWSRNLTALVGKNVARYRKELKLTTQQLSERCDSLGYPISRTSITKIETGVKESLSIQELVIFSSTLNVPLLNLLVDAASNVGIEFIPNQTFHAHHLLSWLPTTSMNPTQNSQWAVPDSVLKENSMVRLGGRLAWDAARIRSSIETFEEKSGSFIKACAAFEFKDQPESPHDVEPEEHDEPSLLEIVWMLIRAKTNFSAYSEAGFSPQFIIDLEKIYNNESVARLIHYLTKIPAHEPPPDYGSWIPDGPRDV